MKTNSIPLLKLAGLGLVAAALLTGCAVNIREVSEEFHQTSELDAKGTVSLANVNGGVRVATWDRNEVKVDAVKRANDPERLAEIKIEIETTPDRIEIKTKIPRSPRLRWFWHGNNNSASVQYVLTVPTYAQLESISTVNGGVKIEGVKGNVAARTVNGQITAKNLNGTARLTTVNGGVRADFAELKDVKSISLETVNGGVSLALPADANADVEASTVNGGISTDLPLTVTKHFPVGRNLHGKLGEGGTRIKASTVNGGIRINRS